MLEIRRLGFRYPGASVDTLDGVALQVQRGSVLGLLGPNGAGKTTLISHLSGQLPLQRGEIEIDGEPLSRVRTQTPTRLAVAPQEFAFYPMLSVVQNLACFAAAARIPSARRSERVQACLAAGQLEAHAGQLADRLSGGLKRRLNLAISLLPEPELIVFDEPTVGVDPQTRAFLLASIQQLAQQGAAVIYSSHYMDEIEAIADRVLIIDHGRVLRSGSLGELLAESTESMSLTVDSAEAAAVQVLLANFGVLQAAGATLQLVLAPGRRPAEVLAALDTARVQLRHAELGRANLEQLFMTLTQRRLRD